MFLTWKKNEELFCSMPVPQAILTLAVPLFMFMTALANLFGVGGASLISRFLGGGERKRHHAAAHSASGQPQGFLFCMLDAIRTLCVFSLGVALAIAVLLYTQASAVSRLFINNRETVAYG